MNIAAARHVLSSASVAIAAAAGCALLALFVGWGTVRGAGGALASALIYMAPLFVLQILAEDRLRSRADALAFPMDWVLYGSARTLMGAAAAITGSALMILFGVVPGWQHLQLANRMVVVVSVIAACGMRFYSVTRTRLEERNRQLQTRVTVHQQEVERAREIQAALMPAQLPRVRGVELAARCEAARVVGGDYYDVIRLSDTAVALAIADVSGKGMGAALLMSNLQSIVRAFAPQLGPAELCAKANQLISANVAPGKFITFFYAVADIARMRVEYCNAGHNPPVLRRADSTIERLEHGGTVLGVFPDASYSRATVEARSGDLLMLFTDGISEAMDPDGEEFGEERLTAILSSSPASAKEVSARIMSAVADHSRGTLHDDATVLAARFE